MISTPLSQPLEARGKRSFRVIPAGRFKARDGRPKCGHWTLTEEAGRNIVAMAAARQTDIVIDYEHASLGKNPAPAAGWFKALEWRPDGVYVTDARWTAAAAKMIDAQEYRYISPVIKSDEAGIVTELFNIALVNNPALDGLTDLALLSNLGPAAQASLEQRLRNDVHDTGMTEQQKLYFTQVFGHTPGELNAMALSEAALAQTQAKRMEEGFEGMGMTDRQKDYFLRVFGHTPAELRRMKP